MTTSVPGQSPTRPGSRRILLDVGVSVLLIGYLLTLLDWRTLQAVLGRLSGWALPGLFTVYLGLNLCRALRFKVLLGERDVPFATLFPITLIHNALSQTLPFRLGDLSYVALLKRSAQSPITAGIGSLLVVRLLEMILVLLGGAAGYLCASPQPGAGFFGGTGVLLALLLAALLAGILLVYRAGGVLERLRPALLGVAFRVVRSASLRRKGEETLTSVIRTLKSLQRPGLFARAAVLSLAVYALSILYNSLLMNHLGVQQGWGAYAAIVSLTMMTAAVPLSVSGFGTVEGGWILGLTFLGGLDLAQATAIGFLIHAIHLLAAVISGLVGYFLLPKDVGRQPVRDTEPDDDRATIRLQMIPSPLEGEG